jgi:DNA transposition AAA+ family ATPase
LFFDSGINPIGGLLSVLQNAGRIVVSGKGTYKVLDPWADGKEYTFKASTAKKKEKNDVPLELLMDCPKLVDAATADEVREYLAPYSTAMDTSASGAIEEEDFDEFLTDDE